MIKGRRLLIFLLIFVLIGCSHGISGNDQGPDTMLNSDKIQAAKLNDFWVEN